MVETQAHSTIRAIKNSNDETVLIYHATPSKSGAYEVSVERYLDDKLTQAAVVQTDITDTKTIDRLLLEMCKGMLEPCHLKDVIEDMAHDMCV